MILPMIGNWFSNIMATLFVGMFDTVAYWLLSVSYTVFDAIAKIDLFGASSAGNEIYNLITKRFYTALSIIMVFVFAYQMIMLIVDPDGKAKGSSTKLVKETVVSIIMVILLPTVFKYMAYFQIHVIDNGTIPALILGNNGFSEDNPGRTIAMMTYMSFFHPNGTSWNDYFDENGKIRVDADSISNAAKTIKSGDLITGVTQMEDAVTNSTAFANCTSKVIYGDVTKGFLFVKWQEDGENNAETICKKYVSELLYWKLGLGAGVSSITTDSSLREAISEDNGSVISYQWILATAAGILVAWMFFSYSIDIGTRAVKLGVLQLIAPVPVISRIFNRKMFDTWFKEIKKCYLELFIRLAIIFFGIVIIQLVPQFIDMVFKSIEDEDGLFAKCIATFLLILGILKFCQDAPGLFKEIFSAGGNLLEGMNLKPGVRSRIEDNKLAMKGYGAMAGAAGGAFNRFGSNFKKSLEDTKGAGASGGNKLGRYARAIGAGLKGTPRGLIAGGKSGLKNTPTKINMQSLRDTTSGGVTAAKISNARKSKYLQDLEKAKREYIQARSDHSSDPTAVKKREEAFTNLWKTRVNSTKSALGRTKAGIIENTREGFNNSISDTIGYSETNKIANAIKTGFDSIKTLANNKDNEAKKTELEQKLSVTPETVTEHRNVKELAPVYTYKEVTDATTGKKTIVKEAKRDAHGDIVYQWQNKVDANGNEIFEDVIVHNTQRDDLQKELDAVKEKIKTTKIDAYKDNREAVNKIVTSINKSISNASFDDDTMKKLSNIVLETNSDGTPKTTISAEQFLSELASGTREWNDKNLTEFENINKIIQDSQKAAKATNDALNATKPETKTDDKK